MDTNHTLPEQSSNMDFEPVSVNLDSFEVLGREAIDEEDNPQNELSTIISDLNISSSHNEHGSHMTNGTGEQPLTGFEMLQSSEASYMDLPVDIQHKLNSLISEKATLQDSLVKTNASLAQILSLRKDELAEIEKEREEHKEIFLKANSLVMKLTKEKEKMRETIEDLQSELIVVKEALAESKKLKETEEEKQQQDSSKEELLCAENFALKKEIENVISDANQAKAYQIAQSEGFSQKVDELTAKLMITEDQLHSAQQELSKLKGQIHSEDSATIDRLRQRVDEMTHIIVDLEDKSSNQTKEISTLQGEIAQHLSHVGILQAQVEVYQSDFLKERESRERLAGEKEQLAEDLRQLNRLNQQLQGELRADEPNPSRRTPTEYKCPICTVMLFRTLEGLNDHMDTCLLNI